MSVVLLIAGCLAIFFIGIWLIPESPNEKFVRYRKGDSVLRVW